MIRKSRALGLAVMALAAVGLFSSGAQAAQLAAGTNTISEAGIFKFDSKDVNAQTLDGFSSGVTCKESELEGTVVSGVEAPGVELPSESVPLIPHYSSCTAFGGLPAKVTTNGCHYVFHAFSKLSEGEFSSQLDVACASGSEAIEIEVWLNDGETGNKAACIVKVPPQTNLKGLVDKVDSPNAAERAAGKRDDITLEGTVAGIKETQTRNSFLCPAGTETSEGKLTIPNAVTVQATEDNAKKPLVDLWIA